MNININTKDINTKIKNSIANPGAKIIRLAEILLIIEVYVSIIGAILWAFFGLFVCAHRYGFAFELYFGVLLGIAVALISSYFSCLFLRSWGELVDSSKRTADGAVPVREEIIPEELKF